MAMEKPGGKRNLNMNVNTQQAILNVYIALMMLQCNETVVNKI